MTVARVEPAGPVEVGLVLPGGWLLLAPRAVRRVRWWGLAAQHVGRLDGIRPPLLDDQVRALAAAALACAGEHGEYAPGQGRAGSQVSFSEGWSDPVGSGEAARILGVSRRNVQALCRRGSLETAGLRSGRWLVERAEVAARAGTRPG